MDIDDEELEIKVATPDIIPTKRGKKATPLAAQISAGLGTLSGSNSPRQGSMPPPPVPRSQSGANSRAGSRGRGRGHSLAMSVEPDPEPELEMEVDIIDGAEVEADDQLYCFCQQKSFGEMIGCDNDKCKYEWVSGCRAQNGLTPVPCQVCQPHRTIARDVVLPRVRQDPRPHVERRQARTQGAQEVGRRSVPDFNPVVSVQTHEYNVHDMCKCLAGNLCLAARW
jgi:hypothetical protein